MADEGLRVVVKGWEDGQKMEKEIEEPDRWSVQAGDTIFVESPTEYGVSVTVTQKRDDLKEVGVGALVWEGALVLSQHVSRLPPGKLRGARVVELGAGLGLVGLLAAKRGARVTLTDVAALLPSLESNSSANQPMPEPGTVEIAELEWGSAGAPAAIEVIKEAGPIDFVLAADFLYPETPGLHGNIHLEAGHPVADAFFDVAAALCTPKRTRCLFAFEVRGDWMLSRFLECARAHFKKVKPVKRTSLPPAYRREHIEMYELMK